MWRFEGAKRKAERGIKGIIGIFFFHFSGSERGAGKLIRVVLRWRNRNLLILNWLFGCGKMKWNLRLFLRGYPRASSFCLGWLLLCQLRSEF
jgi:hypothetical protein